MEDSKSGNEAHKLATKQKITQIYQNFINNSCANKDCINKFCKNSLKRELGKEEGEELTQQDCLAAAVKLIKHELNTNIPSECPPEPLFGEAIDELLDSKDEDKILSRIREVFCNLESLASSFYPMEQGEKRFNFHHCSADVDYIRLNKVYDELWRISESEEGVYEKILQESIRNIHEQLKNYDKPHYKYMSLP
jgi:hypothetical protein